MRSISKRYFAVLLAVMMVLSALPAAALADAGDPAEQSGPALTGGSTLPTEQETSPGGEGMPGAETAAAQVQALIDALPDAETITVDSRADVQAQLDAIGEAMLALTAEELAALDTARYDGAAAALLALEEQTGDNAAPSPDVTTEPSPAPAETAAPGGGPEASPDGEGTPGAETAAARVQALIDALPDAETITAESRSGVEAQLAAIDAAKLTLTQEESGALDIARYEAAAAALLALDGLADDEPMAAALEGMPGDGSAGDPYQIGDAAQLKAFRDYINEGNGSGEYFELTADIDLENEPWTPIGSESNPFAGTFDGGGHTVRGLYIDSGSGSVGLFGVLGTGGTVKELTVSGTVRATGADNVGGIVGQNSGGTIEDCLSSVSVTGGDHSNGGIAGSNTGSILRCRNDGAVKTEGADFKPSCFCGGIAGWSSGDGMIAECQNYGPVSSEKADCRGGIVGDNRAQIVNCTNYGEISGSCTNAAYAGGIAGNSEGRIENCDNAASVGGAANAGGIAGITSGFGGIVRGCRNTGNVMTISSASARYAGGIAGQVGSDAAVEGCVNAAASVQGPDAGGVAGYSKGAVRNCYNLSAVSGDHNTGGVVGYIESSFAVVENCYSTGALSVGDEYTSGVIGRGDPRNPKNCYYLDSTASRGISGYGTDDSETKAMTAEQFASGEVAWLLQNGQSGQVWGQKLGGDAVPQLTGAGEKKVYQVIFLSQDEQYAVKYANPGGMPALPGEPAREGYAFAGWATVSGGSPDFTAASPVSADMTVYAVFTELPKQPESRTGDLTVTVTVSGEGTDPDRAWHFRVVLDDKSVSGQRGGMLFTDGVAEFALKHGQSVTAQGLPEGAAYTVTELEADQDGCVTTCTNGKGTIVSGQTMAAAFVNDLPAPAKPDGPEATAAPTAVPTAAPTAAAAPSTGDPDHPVLWLSILCLSLAGTALTALRPALGKRKPAGTDHSHTGK